MTSREGRSFINGRKETWDLYQEQAIPNTGSNNPNSVRELRPKEQRRKGKESHLNRYTFFLTPSSQLCGESAPKTNSTAQCLALQELSR